MNYSIWDFLQLIGSLGVFLYGMKLMSEALQKVAGNKMRKILAAMTSNRVKGVVTGLLITAIIQSSSATTVMVVSFVNAGLLDLVSAIGVIMGANVGTTFTAWLISILGFQVSMGDLSLILIGAGVPLLFSRKRIRKSWGEFIIGFGLLFIGLEFLQQHMPKINENPELLRFLRNYTDLGYGSYLIFLLIGTFLTVIIQSSSATMALTLVMCANGWIGFDIAASMVLGENIGTTITANLAATVANTAAKRAAFAHFLFNMFGVCWVMALKGVGALSVELGIGDPFTDTQSVPVALSLFHTCFNVANVLILIWFTKSLAHIVTRIVKPKESAEDAFTLKHIKIGLLSTPEASLFQAKQEIVQYAQNTQDMYRQVVECLHMPSREFETKFEKIDKLEDESDVVEVEIADYLTKVSESKLSTENTQRIRAKIRVVAEIESIADSSLILAKAIARRNEQGIVFPENIDEKLQHMMAIVDESLTVMCGNLSQDYPNVKAKKAYEVEQTINDYRTILQQEHLTAIEEKKYDYATGIIYSDIFSECEKIGDHAINVTEAIKEISSN